MLRDAKYARCAVDEYARQQELDEIRQRTVEAISRIFNQLSNDEQAAVMWSLNMNKKELEPRES